MNAPICQYCNQGSRLVGGDELYPQRRDLRKKKFYHCAPCGAWVGCHPGTDKPLGSLANYELRIARAEAHAEFDPLWKHYGMSRSEAYARLAKFLEIDVEHCHIGMFNELLCMGTVTYARLVIREHFLNDGNKDD